MGRGGILRLASSGFIMMNHSHLPSQAIRASAPLCAPCEHSNFVLAAVVPPRWHLPRLKSCGSAPGAMGLGGH